jgi:hypothetical protein
MAPLLQVSTLLICWLALVVIAYLAAPIALVLPVLLPVLYWVIVLRGSEERAAVAEEKLKSTLMQHETVVVSGLQLRIGALLSRRLLVALTNSRAIVISRALLGGFSMRDYQWKDVSDATLRENILPGVFGSRLAVKGGQGTAPVVIDALPSNIAGRMYAHAQAEEQAWEEKRRVRALEETRAASGGVIVGAPSMGGVGGGPGVSMLEALDRARKLFDSGAISDAEYQELKSKILNGQAF